MIFIHILFYPLIAEASLLDNFLNYLKTTLNDKTQASNENIQLSSPLILTPFIKNSEISEARKRSRVIPDIGGVTTYSGFFTTNEACGNHLFFWFVPALTNWKAAPVVLWLNGGPGGSSLFGLFHEIGPWKFENGKLINNRFSWTKIANLLFIDQPVGTGFSFSDKGCFAKNKQDVTADLYSAVLQFFTMFPEFKANKFFLAGMSFAGHYVPETAAFIDERNEVSERKINLAGILVGSPSLQNTCHYKGDLLYELGIVDEHDRDVLKDLHEELVQHIEAKDIQQTQQTDYKIQSKLQEIGLPNYFHILNDKPAPDTYEFSNFVSSIRIKEQIHVGDSSHQYMVINPDVFGHYVIPYYESSAPAVDYLLKKNYIVGFFSGQLDVICSFTYFECVFKDLEWAGAKGYRDAVNQPWYVSNRLAGWFKAFGNLFTVLIRNSGHNIPEDQGEIAFLILKSVLNSQPENLLKDFSVKKQ